MSEEKDVRESGATENAGDPAGMPEVRDGGSDDLRGAGEDGLPEGEDGLTAQERDRRRQIEIDRYIMLDDEGRKSGLIKSVVLIAVTLIVVAAVLSVSVVTSMRQGGNVSGASESNRKIFLETYTKKLGQSGKNSPEAPFDYRFQGNRFMIKISSRDAEPPFSGEILPKDLKAEGRLFMAQTLCHDGAAVIQRPLEVNEVDYLFYHDGEQLYTVRVTQDNCRNL